MQQQLSVWPDAETLAREAARLVAARADAAVAAHGAFRMAVSGGRTPWAMFSAIGSLADFPWSRTELFQVDERVVPMDHPDRNLALLREVVPEDCTVFAMPVEESDLQRACASYAAVLPERFDLIHLGIGADGHTASLVPGDPSLDVTDRLVTLTGAPYQGHVRMTLTYPALQRTDALLWLVSGASKQDALRRLLDGDPAIPAGRVVAPRSIVLADLAASASG